MILQSTTATTLKSQMITVTLILHTTPVQIHFQQPITVFYGLHNRSQGHLNKVITQYFFFLLESE